AELLVAHEAAQEQPQRTASVIFGAAELERVPRGVVAIALRGQVAARRCGQLQAGTPIERVGAEARLGHAARLCVAQADVQAPIDLAPEPAADRGDVNDVKSVDFDRTGLL